MTTFMQPFDLALIQMRMVADPEANLATAESMIRQAAAEGARVVALPELFRTPYFCQTQDETLFDLAEPVPGPTCERLAALARALGVVIEASLFERRAPGLYHNTAVVLDADGRIASRYRKLHIPDDPQFLEKFYFAPGDLPVGLAETAAGPLGTLICWDQWYPEAARLCALRGALLTLYPTAIGWLPEEGAEQGEAQHAAWRAVQRGHAVANGMYVAAVNRVGFEPRPAVGGGESGAGIHFWGRSFVVDPFGAVIAEAPADESAILHATIDPARQESIRRTWPFLRDRRVDRYAPLTARYLDGAATGTPGAPAEGANP